MSKKCPDLCYLHKCIVMMYGFIVPMFTYEYRMTYLVEIKYYRSTLYASIWHKKFQWGVVPGRVDEARFFLTFFTGCPVTIYPSFTCSVSYFYSNILRTS